MVDCAELRDSTVRVLNAPGSSDAAVDEALGDLRDHCPREHAALAAEAIDGISGRAEPIASSGLPAGALSWDAAIGHVGSHQQVCGPLATVRGDADDVFFNIGRDWPDTSRFTIVVWDVGEVGGGIPAGTVTCASGLVTSWEGVAQIELSSLNDLTFWG